MQIAGVVCVACANRVQAAEDGTWCAACRTVLHRRCLEGAQNRCPTCQSEFRAPEPQFHYSELCPVCMRPTGGRRSSCSACGSGTVWDTQDDYARFRELHRRSTRGLLVRGVAALALGLAVLALFLGLALPGAILPEGWPIGISPVAWFGGPLLLLGILCCGYGLNRALRGLALRGFR